MLGCHQHFCGYILSIRKHEQMQILQSMIVLGTSLWLHTNIRDYGLGLGGHVYSCLKISEIWLALMYPNSMQIAAPSAQLYFDAHKLPPHDLLTCKHAEHLFIKT